MRVMSDVAYEWKGMTEMKRRRNAPICFGEHPEEVRKHVRALPMEPARLAERLRRRWKARLEGGFLMNDVMKRHAHYLVCVLALGLALACWLAAGEFAWVSQFGSTESDYAFGIAVDATGVYGAGRTVGAPPGQVSAGGDDAFVRKYTHSGEEVWTRQFGSAAGDEARAIAVDSTGVYVAGRLDGVLPGKVSAGSSDAFVRKWLA